jgi:ABC-type Mn2+/Zn2+ transport system ATPase subunit
MTFLKWDQLVAGYEDQKPLMFPSSGQIDKPGIYLIAGQNGAGKSALIKTWVGLLKPLAGRVEPFRLKKNQPYFGISYIPQYLNINTYFHLSVSDFVSQGYGLTKNLSAKEKARDVESMLEKWQLAGFEHTSMHDLSGGQKTRALIVRAILSHPKLLFLDEPLASLDSCCQLQLMQTLHTMAQDHSSCIIMIDHHFEKFEPYLSSKFTLTRKHNDFRCSFSQT